MSKEADETFNIADFMTFSLARQRAVAQATTVTAPATSMVSISTSSTTYSEKPPVPSPNSTVDTKVNSIGLGGSLHTSIVGGPGIFVKQMALDEGYDKNDNGGYTEEINKQPGRYLVAHPPIPEDAKYEGGATYLLGVRGGVVQWILAEACPESGSGDVDTYPE